jgi:hypothetical protein
MAAALKTHWCDKALDFRTRTQGIRARFKRAHNAPRYANLRLGIRLCIFLFRTLHLTPNHILPNIVILAQVEEPSNLSCPLGTESLGEHVFRKPRKGALALLHDDEGQHGDIRADDASSDGFALALTAAAGAVARVAVGEEEFHSVGEEDALLHGKPLLVITAGDTEDVALKFVA